MVVGDPVPSLSGEEQALICVSDPIIAIRISSEPVLGIVSWRL